MPSRCALTLASVTTSALTLPVLQPSTLPLTGSCAGTLRRAGNLRVHATSGQAGG